MSWLTIGWAMCAAASGMLALIHLDLWSSERRRPMHLMLVCAALGAAACTITEMLLFHAQTVRQATWIMKFQVTSVALLVIPLVWFAYCYFREARRFLAVSITVLWSVSAVVNFASPHGLVFQTITELQHQVTWWGESFRVPTGPANRWNLTTNVASLLILVYFIDAAARSYRLGEKRKALVVGGGTIFFIFVGAVQTMLVDSGVLQLPYMVSFSFMAIVMAMTHELVHEAALAGRYARRIAANKEQWRKIRETVALAILRADKEGRMVDVNPFLIRLSGYSRDELLGSPLEKLVPPAERREWKRHFNRAGVERTQPSALLAIRCKSGEHRQVAWSTVRLTDEDGQVAGFMAIGADVTDQQRAQAELMDLQRDLGHLSRVGMLGEMVSGLAHELNQPLAAILSNAQAARRFMDAADPDLREVRSILDDIVRDDKRAGEVIHGLRGLLRNAVPDPSWSSINQDIEEVLRLMKGELMLNEVTVTRELAPNLPVVNAGKVEIQQVVMNLIVNAMQAMEELPEERRALTLTTGKDGGFVVATLRDSGPGIAGEALPRVFESFFTTKAGGLGLGLSICRRLIRWRGGDIWCRNLRDGGTEFSFRLPAVHALGEEAAPGPAPAAAGSLTGR